MFERFTEEARHVVVLAQEEARALNHSYIGTEHILLGLLRSEEGRDPAERPLASLGVSLEEARQRVVQTVGSGDEPTSGQIPFTPRAKKVLELALREALGLGYNWIAPEHILLGLAREQEGVASRVLLELGVAIEQLREPVIELLATRPSPRAATHSHPLAAQRHLHAVSHMLGPDWLDGLRVALDRLGHEIRQQLGREPDLGDLLLALACAPQTPAGHALRELGIDLDSLWGTLERTRREQAEARKALMGRIEEVRAQKEAAIEAKQFEEAAQLRDEERELSEQAHSGAVLGRDVLAEIRRRLGLASAEE